MDSLIYSLNATIPVFLVIVLGYIFNRKGMFNEGFISAANKFTFRVCLPAMIFADMAQSDITTAFDGKLVVFSAAVTTIMFILIWIGARLFIKDKSIIGAFVQASYRSSVAVMGFAFMMNIYGTTGLMPMIIIGCVPLYNIFAVTVLTFESPDAQNDKNKKSKLRKAAVGIIKNPIIIGIILGMLWSVLNIPQPVMVEKSITYLGNMASPLALIALGASFEFYNVKEKYKETIGITGIKLFLFCIIFLPLAVMMGFRNEKLVAILVMLGSATTSSCFIMAKNMGHEGKISSCSVMVTTLFSSFSLTMWLFILKTLQYI